MNPLLMPVVAVQGMRVVRSTVLLPPAAGPIHGTAGTDAPGPLLRIAVVGESTAAGCGVDTHDDGFAGCLAHELAERSDGPVAWEVVGQHGATVRRIRYRLLPQLGENIDLAVLLAGVNDVLGRRTPAQWGDDLAAVVDDLGARATHVAVTGIPPFQSFPALPGVLSRYLAERAGLLDAVSVLVCAERPHTTWISSTDVMPMDLDFFAADRFHPSALGYQRWAAVVADHLTMGE